MARALTLDFYNTLVFHRDGRGRGAMLTEYLREHGLESDPWEHQVLYDVFAAHGIDYAPSQSPGEKQRYYERIAVHLFERLNVRAPPYVAKRHAPRLWEILGPQSLAVFPEVHRVLGALAETGLPLALVSNWQCGLEHFCTELGLAGAFQHILASAEVGAAKPDPAIFVEACQRLGFPPELIVHVGDDPVNDVEGGRAVGLQVVLVQREGASGRAVDAPTIPDLSHLHGILGLR